MNFTYEIKKYNKDTASALVLYTPEDSSLEPKYKWVSVLSSWNAEDIKAEIIKVFPKYLWESANNTAIKELLETSIEASYSTPVVEEYTPTSEELAEEARSKRKGLLFDSDWTQLADAPLTAEQKAAWETYRQGLRDITNQVGFPTEISWPVAP